MSPILDDTSRVIPTVFPPDIPTVFPPNVPTLGTNRRPTLNLGVIVQPYRAEDAKSRPVTTADVAKWLENEYGIMQVFARVHWTAIESSIRISMQNSLEALVMGRRVDPFGRGMQVIQSRFKQFISSSEAERVGIPGTPTGAASRGVNHRRKHPYAKSNPRRPSFYDSHTYANSFAAWMS
jgi:hypothetical protein